MTVEVTLTIHTMGQFNAIIRYCNNTFGHGKQNWTSKGRVRRFIDTRAKYKNTFNPPRIIVWVVHNFKAQSEIDALLLI